VAQSAPAPPAPAPPPDAPPAPAPPVVSGNTALDNSTGIATQLPSEGPAIQPKSFVWNWNWNCDGSSIPDAPAPPPDAASITINWNWNCPGMTPPPLSSVGTTICVDCNIAIAVRVASAGDSGAVTQLAGAADAPASANGAAIAQAVVQETAPPAPPEVPPPVPPPVPGVEALPASPPPPGALDPTADDPPRHGGVAFTDSAVRGPHADGTVGGRSERHTSLLVGVVATHAQSTTSVTSAGATVATYTHVESHVTSHVTASSSAPRPAPRELPRHLPPGAPIPPSSISSFAPAEATHGASAATVALWIGALSLGGIGFLVVMALLELWARGTAVRARPDPPG
jgi:hypothetical protein